MCSKFGRDSTGHRLKTCTVQTSSVCVACQVSHITVNNVVGCLLNRRAPPGEEEPDLRRCKSDTHLTHTAPVLPLQAQSCVCILGMHLTKQVVRVFHGSASVGKAYPLSFVKLLSVSDQLVDLFSLILVEDSEGGSLPLGGKL